MNAIILDSNLMFSTRIEKGLQHMGYAVKTVLSAEQLQAVLNHDPLSLALINYGDSSYDAIELTRVICSSNSPPHILGYVSHGAIPSLRPIAYAAGCSLLVANSAITSKLSQLVKRVMADTSIELDEE